MGLIEPVQAANDWPQWRGPNRDGVLNDAGASDILSPERAEVSWRASVGPGFSSPVVADGRVIVTDALLAPASASERVLCFDEKTGQLQWEFEYAVAYPDWAFAEDQQGGPRATPVVNGGKVFTIGALGDVYCLDAATGVRVWHRSLAADYAVKEFTGITASPLIDGHVLILLVGGKPDACVLALDTGTGKEVWKALDEDASHSSPLIVSAGGERQLIVWTLQSISSLNPATGKVWWRQRLLTSADGAISSPVHDHDALLIGGLMLTLAADKPGGDNVVA